MALPEDDRSLKPPRRKCDPALRAPIKTAQDVYR
jgi:hypothetical protein